MEWSTTSKLVQEWTDLAPPGLADDTLQFSNVESSHIRYPEAQLARYLNEKSRDASKGKWLAYAVNPMDSRAGCPPDCPNLIYTVHHWTEKDKQDWDNFSESKRWSSSSGLVQAPHPYTSCVPIRVLGISDRSSFSLLRGDDLASIAIAYDVNSPSKLLCALVSDLRANINAEGADGDIKIPLKDSLEPMGDNAKTVLQNADISTWSSLYERLTRIIDERCTITAELSSIWVTGKHIRTVWLQTTQDYNDALDGDDRWCNFTSPRWGELYEVIHERQRYRTLADAMRCPCGESAKDTEDDFIQCNMCYQWYHYMCELLADTPAESEPYYCLHCRARGKTEVRVLNLEDSDDTDGDHSLGEDETSAHTKNSSGGESPDLSSSEDGDSSTDDDDSMI